VELSKIPLPLEVKDGVLTKILLDLELREVKLKQVLEEEEVCLEVRELSLKASDKLKPEEVLLGNQTNQVCSKEVPNLLVLPFKLKEDFNLLVSSNNNQPRAIMDLFSQVSSKIHQVDYLDNLKIRLRTKELDLEDS
jgi:hypothetical protein